MHALAGAASAAGQRRKELYINSIAFILLMSCLLFSQMPIFDFVAILVFTIWIYRLFRLRNGFFWKYIFIFYSAVGCLSGVIVCEYSSIYLRELSAFSGRNRSIPPIILYFFLLILCTIAFDKRHSRKNNNNVHYNWKFNSISITSIILKYILYIIFALNCFLFLMVMRRPFFIYGIDRFDYISDYLPSVVRRAQWYPIYLAPLAIMAIKKKYSLSVKKQIISLFLIYSPFVLYSFWTGNKFGTIWMLFYSLVVPAMDYVDYGMNAIRNNTKKALFIAVSFLTVIIAYYVIQDGGFDKALISFSERVAMQGQLWWRTYGANSNQGLHLTAFFDELGAIWKSIVSRGDQREYGVYRLMQLYAPSSLVSAYLSRGVRFSARGIELPYYFFKEISLFVIPIVNGYIYSFVTNLYVSRTRTGCFVEAIIGCRLLSMIMSAVGQGDYFALFSVETVIWYILLIILHFYKKYNYVR